MVRNVLQASNSLRWFHFDAWIFQTEDEYVDGTIALIRAMQEVPDANLTIREKKMDRGALETLFRPHGPYTLKFRSDNPFEQDLASADLMISYMSTTIMQALHARKPVLLWGGTQRYQHLPARATPPTADDRAAVYVVKAEADLAPMIAAILDAHAGHPLTDQELDGYVWPAGTPDLKDLAQAIANRNLDQLWERGNEPLRPR